MSFRQKQADFVTFGYVGQQSVYSIPIVIIKLIQAFYNVYFQWEFKGNQLTQFLNTPHSQCIISRAFTVDNIEFELKVFPNGKSYPAEGYIGCYLSVKKVPNNIEYFSLYLRLECEINEEIYDFNNIIKWTKDNNKVCRGWSAQPKLTDCNDLKAIWFNCYIDMLYIKYIAECNKMDYIKDIKVAKQTKYYWIIDGKQLEKFRNTHPKIGYVSDSFGYKAWCLEFIPNGQHNTDRVTRVEKAAMFVKLIAIPFGVKEMEIDCILSRDDDIKISRTVKLNHKKNHTGVWVGDIIKNSYQQCLVLSVEVEIKRVFDENDEEIDQSSWNKFSIV